MIHKPENFSLNSEEQSSNWEFQSLDKQEEISAIEELSAIPNIKELQELKANTTDLSNKLIEKINSLAYLETILSKEEIEFLASMKDFIVTKEKDQSEICIDIDYVDSIRKQQLLIVKILQEITSLQWRVEKRYEEIKSKEVNKETKRDCNKDCIVESVKSHTTCGCSIY